MKTTIRQNKLKLFIKYHLFRKSRAFLRHIWRKYVLWYDYWNEVKLDDRKDRQNRHFKWNARNIQNINELNAYLAGLMEEVYTDCENLKKQHDTWIAEGKDYYRHYEIKGYIVHMQTDYDDLNRRQASFADAQDHVTDHDAWCIRISDNTFCKTEIFKELQFKNGRLWESEFSATLKAHGVENPCSYLDAFLNINHAFSLQDFVEMSEDDFYKNIEVKYVS